MALKHVPSLAINGHHITEYRTNVAAALVAICGVLTSTDRISFLNDPKAGAMAIASSIPMALMQSFPASPAGDLLATFRNSR